MVQAVGGALIVAGVVLVRAGEGDDDPAIAPAPDARWSTPADSSAGRAPPPAPVSMRLHIYMGSAVCSASCPPPSPSSR